MAADLFRQVAAPPWEDRAEAELRATGETARRRDPSTLDQLTPQELQIAGLVASGLTNRQVAAQLYLSPRTIDYHYARSSASLALPRGPSWCARVRHSRKLDAPTRRRLALHRRACAAMFPLWHRRSRYREVGANSNLERQLRQAACATAAALAG